MTQPASAHSCGPHKVPTRSFTGFPGSWKAGFGLQAATREAEPVLNSWLAGWVGGLGEPVASR